MPGEGIPRNRVVKTVANDSRVFIPSAASKQESRVLPVNLPRLTAFFDHYCRPGDEVALATFYGARY